MRQKTGKIGGFSWVYFFEAKFKQLLLEFIFQKKMMLFML